MTDNNSFWHFPECAKWDQISEISHPRLVDEALQDRLTGAEIVDSEHFILFGPEEALLFEPQSVLYRVVLYLYTGLWRVISTNKEQE